MRVECLDQPARYGSALCDVRKTKDLEFLQTDEGAP